MHKANSFEVQILTMFLISLVVTTTSAPAIIQNPKLSNMNDGFLELKPNGSLILRSSFNNSTNGWQDAFIFKTILNAIGLMPLQEKNTLNDLKQKIYGDGVEHKFPPFLERVIQRIQTYFSVYKYTDTSKPLWENNKSTISTTSVKATTSMPSSFATASATATATSATISETLTLSQKNKITANLNSGNYNTATTTKSTVVYDEDNENEFIEIKDRKSFESRNS